MSQNDKAGTEEIFTVNPVFNTQYDRVVAFRSDVSVNNQAARLNYDACRRCIERGEAASGLI